MVKIIYSIILYHIIIFSAMILALIIILVNYSIIVNFISITSQIWAKLKLTWKLSFYFGHFVIYPAIQENLMLRLCNFNKHTIKRFFKFLLSFMLRTFLRSIIKLLLKLSCIKSIIYQLLLLFNLIYALLFVFLNPRTLACLKPFHLPVLLLCN